MQKSIILFLLLFFSTRLFAQDATVSAKAKIDQAIHQYDIREFKASLLLFEEAFQVEITKDAYNLYNAACSAALCGEKNTAWKYLRMSLDKGYKNYVHLFQDADFNSLHDDNEWKILQNEKGFDLEKVKKAFANIHTEADLRALVPFKRGKVWGYMQYGTKKIKIEPMFSRASFFYKHHDWNSKTGEELPSERMEIELNEYKVHIKPNGEITTTFPPDDMRVMAAPEGFGDEGGNPKQALKTHKEGLGFIEEGGEITAYSREYESIERMYLNNQVCAKVKCKERYGIVNNEGNPILPVFAIQYKVLDTENRTSVFYAQNSSDEKWNILTKGGKPIIQDLDVSPTESRPFYIIKRKNKWGVINLEGKKVIVPTD